MTHAHSPIGPLRVLIADRRGWIARALTNVLDPSEWSAHHCHGALDLLRTLPEEEPHLIVLHDDLQDMPVDELLGRLRADPGVGVLTPIVVLSTRAQRVRRLELLRAGATDHMLFPSDPEGLVIRFRSLAAARREAERLGRAALVDTDSGLYNPAGIAHRGREIATDAARRREPISCVVFSTADGRTDRPRDLETASELGGIIRRTARLSDAVGQVNDVVVIIAPATGLPGAQRLAERIQYALAGSAGRDGGGEGQTPEAPAIAAAAPRAQPDVRAAYTTVADFARSTLGVPEMIERAIRVLATAQDGERRTAIIGESIPLSDEAGRGRSPEDAGNT
jgi:DNA-binding response OmpR family regulator